MKETMANLNTIFKAYDIRGKVPQELDAVTAERVGWAVAKYLPAGKIAVGRDMRTDSEELHNALVKGLVIAGREVLDLGLTTSDMVYYAIGNYELAGGTMITASHIGAGTNGIKITGPGVTAIGGDSGLDKIKDLVETLSPGAIRTDSTAAGNVENRNLTNEYAQYCVEFAERQFGPLTDLHIGYDAGNGMSGIFVPALESLTSLKINGLFLELDGSFPNHPANPMDAKSLVDLQAQIRDKKLAAGVAFDGDGDRAFLIDERGEILTASVLGAILAGRILQKSPGTKIVYSVPCSRIVAETIKAAGGEPIISRIGHTFVKQKMHDTGAVFGIEASGHFFFADNFGADSGLLAALSGLAILSNAKTSLSQLAAPYRRYAESGELNFHVQDVAALLQKLWDHYDTAEVNELDGLTVKYPEWWFNVHSSNTESLVRVNVEADDDETLQAKLSELTDLIKSE